MSGFFAVFGEAAARQDTDSLVSSIDRLHRCETRVLSVGDRATIGVSWLPNAPLKSGRVYEDSEWMAVISGDVVSVDGKSVTDTIDWPAVLDALRNRNYRHFDTWRGTFALCAYDKANDSAVLVPDRKSQWPVFYMQAQGSLFLASELPSFCHVAGFTPRLSTEWLYDFLFFNFGMFGATYLEDARQMLTGCVLEYQARTNLCSFKQYADLFTSSEVLMSGRKALEYCLDVYKARVPQYFIGADEIACGLTCGWDARTILAFRPDNPPVTTYTYGVPGCEDLIDARRTAGKLDINHVSIEFDNEYLPRLAQDLLQTVVLSGGMQHIQRSTLPYVYDELTHQGRSYPLTLLGISGDMQFRGHGNIPAIISYGVSQAFRTGGKVCPDEPWQMLFPGAFDDFRSRVEGCLGRLESTYGPLDSPEHHLSYLVYEVACKHWAGELMIARQCTTWRNPYLDDDIIELAYRITDSTLKYSKLCPATRGNKGEDVLDGYLISHVDPALARIPVRGIPPALAQHGYWRNLPLKALKRIPFKMLRPLIDKPLEDWQTWSRDYLTGSLHALLFDEDARIRQYVDVKAINLIDPEQRLHYTMRLATAEILLRLLESRWAVSEELSSLFVPSAVGKDK